MTNYRSEPVPTVDNFWLRLDRPCNHMTISSVMVLANPVKLEHLQKIMETRWCTHERFRQRPVYHTNGVYWETDTHFDISNHVLRVGLPGAKDKEELEELVSHLASTFIDPTKPLWDIHLVEDYQGGSAVIWRIHHSYADGIALIQVALSITDNDPAAAVAATALVPVQSLTGKDAEAGAGNLLGALLAPLAPVGKAVGQAVRSGRELVGDGVHGALHPAEAVGTARQGIGTMLSYARHGWEFVTEAAQLLLLPDDSPTCFKGELGVRKRVAWTAPLSLKNVRALGQVLGCTVNDVLLSAVAGALRDYLLQQGETVAPDLEIRAAVPVNLRSSIQTGQLGNYFGMVLLPLPIGIENPMERLAVVHQRMGVLKSSYQGTMMLGLMELLGLGPAVAETWAMGILTNKATAVMTNLPGPQVPLYFAGSRIAEWMFWVPQSGSVGMGVSIITYDGSVQFGLITDRKRVADPALITERFGQEVDKLLLMTMMAPWDRPWDAQEIADSIQAVAAAHQSLPDRREWVARV